MKQRRRHACALAVALHTFALPAFVAHAEPTAPYPSRPVRIILPTTPAGSVDFGARFLADKLRERLGQPFVVENRPGANTIVGTAAVAKAPADGYTLLFVSSSHVIVPLVASRLPYDPVKDFAPIGTLAYTPFVMVTHPALPVTTVQQFIAHAKGRPGQLNYGSSGIGLGSHIAGEVFADQTGVQLQHIPYKGGSQVLQELIGGQVQVSWNSLNAVAPHVKSGRLRALAVSTDARVAALPEVPTFAEAGLPAYRERAWIGLFAPAGTPRPIVDKLSSEITRVLATSGLDAYFEAQGLVPFGTTPEAFAALIAQDTRTLTPIVRKANIRMDNP